MKWNKKHVVFALLLPIQLFLVQILEKHPAFVEKYYANGIYPIISNFFRTVFGWIPYSVGDILLFVFILFLVRFLILCLRFRVRNFLPQTISILAFLSKVYFCFYMFWGLNYYREPLSKNLGYTEHQYTTDELVKSTDYILKQLNTVHSKIVSNDSLQITNPYSTSEMYTLSYQGYQNLSADFPQFTYKKSAIKNSLMGYLQSYNGTSGYFNPFTGEAQVNATIPKTSFPTTACHEMAHQIGYAAENEANFIGFLATNYSSNYYFKYASYRMAFGYSIAELQKRDPTKAKALWKKVNTGIIKDFSTSYTFWQSYKNPFEPIVKKGYDQYLKANKQKDGTASYSYVVDLMISYFKETKQL